MRVEGNGIVKSLLGLSNLAQIIFCTKTNFCLHDRPFRSMMITKTMVANATLLPGVLYYCTCMNIVWGWGKDVMSYLANMRRSSGIWAAGTLRIPCRSCSVRLASSVSVMRLLRGESLPGNNSELELSMLGLVRVMSSLLAAGAEQRRGEERKGGKPW